MEILSEYQISRLKQLEKLIGKEGKFYSVNTCALELAICPDHLNRLCKKYYGLSVKKMISKKRFDQAKEKLVNEQLSIQDVAMELDFSEPSNFTRFFKNIAGMSPKEFRNQFLP